MSKVEIDSDSLCIVLEYAYRGESAQGGFCHLDRQPGCAMCDAFTEAEAAVEEDREGTTRWWTPTWRERYWAMRHALRSRKRRATRDDRREK